MGTPPSERARQAARADRIAAAQAADRRRGRHRLLAVLLVVALAATIMGGVASGIIGDDGEEGDDVDTAAPTTVDPVTGEAPTPPTAPGPTVAVTLPATGEEISGETPCPETDGSSPRTTSFDQPPPMCIDPTARHQATVRTSEGDIRFLLDTEGAPETVNNFVVLSRYRFYDGLPFYEIFPGKMVLAGDATADPALGEGGPGYTIDDEVPDVGAIYPIGTLAMWTDAPDQNGSRFLIASGEEAASLPPQYTAFGIMLDGLEALNAIQRQGDPDSGRPTREIVVESIEIEELPALDDADGGADTTGGDDTGSGGAQ